VNSSSDEKALEYAEHFCDFVECGLDPRGAASVIRAQLIENQRLRAEVARKDRALDEIRALHIAGPLLTVFQSSYRVCAHCSRPWPCKTARILSDLSEHQEGPGVAPMSDQEALRDEIAQAILDRLCPTNCGYRISSGSMWTEADGSIHSRHQQGGPCGIHVGLANAAAAAVLPVLQRRETALIEKIEALAGELDREARVQIDPNAQGDTE
jgi:hypothetical protein